VLLFTDTMQMVCLIDRASCLFFTKLVSCSLLTLGIQRCATEHVVCRVVSACMESLLLHTAQFDVWFCSSAMPVFMSFDYFSP
jgi:hypothetical protein